MGSSPGRAPTAQPAPAPAAAGAEEISVRCPHCSRDVKLPAAAVRQLRQGATVPCPNCGGLMKLP